MQARLLPPDELITGSLAQTPRFARRDQECPSPDKNGFAHDDRAVVSKSEHQAKLTILSGFSLTCPVLSW